MYQWSWLSFGPLHSRCSCQTLNKRKRFRVSEGINVHFFYLNVFYFDFYLPLHLVDQVLLFSLDLHWSLLVQKFL